MVFDAKVVGAKIRVVKVEAAAFSVYVAGPAELWKISEPLPLAPIRVLNADEALLLTVIDPIVKTDPAVLDN